jgi:hypothetical protein
MRSPGRWVWGSSDCTCDPFGDLTHPHASHPGATGCGSSPSGFGSPGCGCKVATVGDSLALQTCVAPQLEGRMCGMCCPGGSGLSLSKPVGSRWRRRQFSSSAKALRDSEHGVSGRAEVGRVQPLRRDFGGASTAQVSFPLKGREEGMCSAGHDRRLGAVVQISWVRSGVRARPGSPGRARLAR